MPKLSLKMLSDAHDAAEGSSTVGFSLDENNETFLMSRLAVLQGMPDGVRFSRRQLESLRR